MKKIAIWFFIGQILDIITTILALRFVPGIEEGNFLVIWLGWENFIAIKLIASVIVCVYIISTPYRKIYWMYPGIIFTVVIWNCLTVFSTVLLGVS